MSSYCSNCCHAARQNGPFLVGLMCYCVELFTLATILQVVFLSCTGMLTVMTSFLHNGKLRLNACSVPRSELIE